MLHAGIKSKRDPLLVGRRNNNLPADGKIPDVEFQKNGETWVLDVMFRKNWFINEEIVIRYPVLIMGEIIL